MADALTTVQAAYAAFGRGDIPAVLDAMADDVEWITPQRNHPMGGTRRGKAGAQEFFGTLNDTLEFQVFEPKELIAQGDKVVVIFNEESTSRATGRNMVDDLAHLLTVRDGKITRFQEFSNTAEFEAATKG